ncbi:MAG: MFS transporter [Firmicutes bacterium]|jgi:MFS family permease|uniref:Major facilitator superfamily (MFS) profile domain-containing protein n=1 Tax=Sulfobacillus benefaciens TaxID=453960 RepID=A0A2T2WUV2_9FIRM|nr:MFS transporter [Bacillota bacterium]MCL5013195.1 MFS transporter [Bacillota bacterium]PSR26002.1 MAG: hypothetical protein C7B43_15430 [Sulfobacillus benefaciens]
MKFHGSFTSSRIIALVTSYRLGKNVFSVSLLWIIYNVSHSALLSGVAFGFQMLPLAVFFPIAGWLVDRLGRNRLLFPLEILRILSLVGLWVVIWSHDLPRFTIYLFFLAIISGFADSLYTVSLYGIIRDSSTDKELPKVNAQVEAVGRVAQLLGPLLAAYFLTHYAIFVVLTIPVVCSITTVVFLMTIPDHMLEERRERIALWSGFSTLRRHHTVFLMTAIAMVTNIAVSAIGALLVFYLRSQHIGSWRAGAAMDMGSVGILVISMIAPWLVSVLSPQQIIALSIGSMGVGITLVGIHGPYILLCLALALGHGPVVIYNTFMQSTIQSNIPREMLGRVGGAIGSLATASMPVAGFFSGDFAQSFGFPLTISFAGIITIFTGILGARLIVKTRPHIPNVRT